MCSKVSLLTGDGKTYNVAFKRTEIHEHDGRTILLQVDGGIFKFERARSSYLNYISKLKNSEVIEIKYYGYGHSACIVRIKKVPS